MAHAPFNQWYSVVTGPGAPIPGQPRPSVWGRFVPYGRIQPLDPPATYLKGYLEYSATGPAAGSFSIVAGLVTVDTNTADRVLVPGFHPGGLSPFWTEAVFPVGGGIYLRAWLFDAN